MVENFIDTFNSDRFRNTPSNLTFWFQQKFNLPMAPDIKKGII